MNLKDKKYQGLFHLAGIFLIPIFIVGIGLSQNYYLIIPLVILIVFIGIKFVRRKE